MSKDIEVPVPKLHAANSRDLPSRPSYTSQKVTPAPRPTYQLECFLNEPADHKSLLVGEEDLIRLARKDTHISALQRQIIDVESLVGDM